MRSLSRTWQILFKGLEEVKAAANALQRTERCSTGRVADPILPHRQAGRRRRRSARPLHKSRDSQGEMGGYWGQDRRAVTFRHRTDRTGA